MKSNRQTPAGLYIHIPFCKSKCLYCDFYSITDQQHIKRVAAALTAEMASHHGDFFEFDSLYFGGGTPSLIENRELERLFTSLREHFSFSHDTEITMEVNPDDITTEKLQFYRTAGVNRISVGVQSFNDKHLLFLGRRHTARRARKAIDLIRKAGFRNFGIDLINCLPGQTERQWKATLAEAVSLAPAHISCYQLTVSGKTPFGRMYDSGSMKLPPDREQRNIFLLTSQLLREAGFIHYEISNFARGMRYRSRHNMKYWNHTAYLGLGPAAHSFLHNRRWWNPASIKEYCAMIEDRAKMTIEAEDLSPEQIELEKILLGMRTLKGIRLKDIKAITLNRAQLHGLIASGKVEVKRGRLIPTVNGYLIADRIPLLLTS